MNRFINNLSIPDLFVLLASISIVACIFSIGNTLLVDSKIDENTEILRSLILNQSEINKDSLKNEVIQLKFERASLTDLLDRQSNYIVLYITLVFAIFGIVGLTISRRVGEHIKEDYEKYKGEYGKEYKTHIDLIINKQNEYKKDILKMNILQTEIQASMFWMEADRKANDHYLFIFRSISAAELFYESFILSGDVEAINNAKLCLVNVNIRLSSKPDIREFKIKNFSIEKIRKSLIKISEHDELIEKSTNILASIIDLYNSSQEKIK